MEERRLLLALALSLLVMTAYSLLFPPAPRPAREAAKATAPAAPSSSPPPSESAPATPVPRPSPSATPEVPEVADSAERRVEVTGPDLVVAFTNRGARLLTWGLPRFPDKRGRAEDLVHAAPGGPRPLDVETEDPTIDAKLKDALFQPTTEALDLAHGPGTLKFAWSDGDLAAEKEFAFPAKGYLASVRVSVRRAGRELKTKVLWGPGIGNPTPEEREVQGFVPAQGIVRTQKVEHVKVSGLTPPGRGFEGVQWAGIETQYFTALFLPSGGSGHAELRPFNLPAREDGKAETAPVLAIASADVPEPVLFYAGPKDYDELARAGHGLTAAVPVGDWIGPIVVALISLLRWVHGHVGNYGWSIIAVTLLINLVMAPLRHFGLVNQRKMAKMSPEMKVIQERYRKVPMMDPKRQQMQEELAKLYNRHGMNMGTQMIVGCLPILLTMPFLIAFYRVLTVSIALRGASFLWIPDLSQKDPLFLTPVLMGASMYLMQKMMPSTLDPAQQRMMMIMPLMLSGMFLWAPAGLNLYWLSSNVFSIVQQGVTQQILGAADAAKGKSK
jgi:YidC/Oxa1 family membrane protein insertase